MPETRAQAARKVSDISSTLSDPPPDIEEAIQQELRQRQRMDKEEQNQASDIEMEEDVEDEQTSVYDPNTPLKIRRVRDIENELHLTPMQSDQLRTFINNEMKNADILGKMTFRSIPKTQHDVVLQQIIETAKRELSFLKDTGVEGTKLEELLLARAKINNSNEKHNEFMVRAGKVHRRAGAPMRVPPPPSVAVDGEEEGMQLGLAGIENAHRTRSASRAHRHSVLAASLNNLGLVERTNTPPQDGHVAQHPDQQTAAAAPPMFKLDMFHPIAFLIRVVNSTTGAAVHTSQLIPTSRRDSVLAIDDMSFDMFIELVSAQVGFDVRGRISAVMPRGESFAPSESRVRLATEGNWKAVLYIVHNARKKTCEFVVEDGEMEHEMEG